LISGGERGWTPPAVRREPNAEAFTPRTTVQEHTTMAWVEPKGAGFRVRHRYPDGTVETLGRYDSKIEARRHAKNFNADPTDPAPQPTPTLAGTLPEPRPALDAVVVAEPVGVAPQLDFDVAIPAPLRPARRTAPKRPRQEAPLTTIGVNGGLTLEQWVKTWMGAHKVAPTTAARYESHLRLHILPKFGATPIAHITRIEVKAWANKLTDRMATSSAHSILTLLSTVMAEAAENQCVPTNPCHGLRLSHRKGPEKAIATPLQVLQIADRLDPVSATMVITAAYTGMRWGEVAALAWHNVLLDQEIPAIVIDAAEGNLRELRGRVWLDEPKTENSVRTVPLPPFLAKLLTTKLAVARYDTVFTGARGAYWRRSNFRQRMWDPAVNGVPGHENPDRREPITPGMTFHGLRHSHKTWMKEDGIDGFVQDKRLGHATPSIGDRYSHITPAMTAHLLERLEARYQQSVREFTHLPKSVPGHSA
jgi:integrase